MTKWMIPLAALALAAGCAESPSSPAETFAVQPDITTDGEWMDLPGWTTADCAGNIITFDAQMRISRHLQPNGRYNYLYQLRGQAWSDLGHYVVHYTQQSENTYRGEGHTTGTLKLIAQGRQPDLTTRIHFLRQGNDPYLPNVWKFENDTFCK